MQRNVSGEPSLFSQYDLLAGENNVLDKDKYGGKTAPLHSAHSPHIFFNVRAPSSIFMCSSQKSGESHTLLDQTIYGLRIIELVITQECNYRGVE